jgi:hypothetical protein
METDDQIHEELENDLETEPWVAEQWPDTSEMDDEVQLMDGIRRSLVESAQWQPQSFYDDEAKILEALRRSLIVRKEDKVHEKEDVALAIEKSMEELSPEERLARFREEQRYDEMRAVAEALRVSKDLEWHHERNNAMLGEELSVEYIEEFVADVRANPEVLEFGNGEWADRDPETIKAEMMHEHRLAVNRRRAVIDERQRSEEFMLENVDSDAVAVQRRLLAMYDKYKPKKKRGCRGEEEEDV